MSDKEPEEKDGLLELIKKLWLPVTSFLGAITLVYNFYKMWQGDRETVTSFLAGSSLLLLAIVLLWANKNAKTSVIWRLTQISLVVYFAGIYLGAIKLADKWVKLENKLVVAIATFDGPEEVYGMHDEIVKILTTHFLDNPDIEIIALSDVINPDQGSPAALNLGRRHFADIIVWGWYYPTQNPNITIHFEFPAPQVAEVFKENSTLNPSATLDDLNSFTFQQQLGADTAAYVGFLDGLIKYGKGDYSAAIEQFDKSIAIIKSTDDDIVTIPLDMLYRFRGQSYFILEKYELAMEDFSKSIELNLEQEQIYIIYLNRGVCHQNLQQYESAILDATKVIELDEGYAKAYFNRAYAYSDLGQNDLALADYSKAIELNPKYAYAYYNRALLYDGFRQYEKAILDYSSVINLMPKYADAYYNRGSLYYYLNQYNQAILDYSYAIKYNPQDADAYYYRGKTFDKIGETAKADADFAKYQQLTGQVSP